MFTPLLNLMCLFAWGPLVHQYISHMGMLAHNHVRRPYICNHMLYILIISEILLRFSVKIIYLDHVVNSVLDHGSKFNYFS